MSQNPPETQQSSPKNGVSPAQHQGRPTLPPIMATDAGSRSLANSGSGSVTPMLSPAPTSSSSANAESQSRSLRMHSILNPSGSQEQQQPQQPGNHRSVSGPLPRSVPEGIAGSPSSQTTPNRTLPPMSSLPPMSTGAHKGEPSGFPHRTLPPSSINIPSAADTRRSPFPSAAAITPQAGTPPVGNRMSYPFPQQQPVPPADRRGSAAIATAPASQSNSPTTSYSSYEHTARNSPTPHYQQQPFYGNGMHNGPQIILGVDQSFRGNQAAGGQSTYQLMTLDTDQGPIQVPVDVQAASKMADEKRKRNAGASARFRQRRKEKEREASMTIQKLENKLRLVGEEKEYYRMERDYFRGLVYNSPAQVHVTPRLPSPKQRQPSDGSSNGGSEWQQSGERGSDDGRNQRRRISGFVEGPGAPAPTQSQNNPPPPPPSAQQYVHAQYQYPTPPDARQQQQHQHQHQQHQPHPSHSSHPSHPAHSSHPPQQPHQPQQQQPPPPGRPPMPQQNNHYGHPQPQPPPQQGYDRAWKPQQ